MDIAIIGAGAAGLAAAIFAADELKESSPRILLLDGARKPGAKILVSGGGRCNVTNERVTPDDYNGGPKPIIRSVLKAFDEQRTIEWMRSLGVQLKLEPSGKYFPVTDQARTVLDALLRAVRERQIDFRAATRITDIRRDGNSFELHTRDQGPFACAQKILVATGGLALPKSGSDGAGLAWLRRLGHSIVPTTPALAPLLLGACEGPGGRFAELAGVSHELRLTLRADSGKKITEITGSTLFTHFGLSGPAPMNMSRHLAWRRIECPDDSPWIAISHPQFASIDQADAWLRKQSAGHPKRLTATALEELYPRSMALLLAEGTGRLAELNRPQRLELARRIGELRVNVTGDRGYAFAETTAGGIDLREVNPGTMESRVVPGMFLCGEVLDVDGRIGGFNFQWAWASGYLAGRGAASAIALKP